MTAFVHFFAVALAATLLVTTLIWHIPMMLWDHLDFVPIYQHWQSGSLSDSTFWRIHGGHLHSAAYAVLLLTTSLSHGHPWLDCLVSWVLLICYAGILLAMRKQTLPIRDSAGLITALLMAFLILNPGHLANLQWGWQIAVFICLLGAAITIQRLAASALTLSHVLQAAVATLFALLSFATAAALIPTALILLAMRTDMRLKERVLIALPWIAMGCAVVVEQQLSPASVPADFSLIELVRYALNFLGGGVARFATDLAPWIAFAGLVSGGVAFARSRDRRLGLPWLGLFLFGVFSAVLIALGRASSYGNQQAFVTRYVSFSSMFWIGWAGLICLARPSAQESRSKWRVIGVCLIGLFAVVNSVQMTRKAARVAKETRATARTLCASYPQVSKDVLREIYFDQAAMAIERLAALQQLGFPPFDACTAANQAKKVGAPQ